MSDFKYGGIRGLLSDLSKTDTNIHLVQSNSSKIDIYIHDTLRETYHASVDSVIQVEDKRSVSYMMELSNLMPYNADKWIFEINWKKAGKFIPKSKESFSSETSVYVINVDHYGQFKEVKEFLKGINELYLSVIRKPDVMYLLNDLEISDKLKGFVTYTYAREPEKIFTLREELLNGYEVTDQKSIVKLLGVSTGSVLNYVMLLLGGDPKTERGLKMVYRKRVQVGLELINAYGVRTFRNFLNSTVYDLLQIKLLYMNGVIYDRIRDLPEGYDEKKLSKYSYCLERITTEISYDRLLRLYTMLQSPENITWLSECDMLSFLYSYYGEVSIE